VIGPSSYGADSPLDVTFWTKLQETGVLIIIVIVIFKGHCIKLLKSPWNDVRLLLCLQVSAYYIG
jgi:hypothetical protein